MSVETRREEPVFSSKILVAFFGAVLLVVAVFALVGTPESQNPAEITSLYRGVGYSQDCKCIGNDCRWYKLLCESEGLLGLCWEKGGYPNTKGRLYCTLDGETYDEHQKAAAPSPTLAPAPTPTLAPAPTSAPATCKPKLPGTTGAMKAACFDGGCKANWNGIANSLTSSCASKTQDACGDWAPTKWCDSRALSPNCRPCQWY